jgi:hypothetical protein
LGGVTVEEVGPVGARTFVTSQADGIATLGQGAGAHVWKFSRDGYLSSFRSEILTTNNISSPYNPRLTARSTNSATFTLSGGTLKGGSVEIGLAAGAFSQATVGTLTPLNAQSLPALLPLGWSAAQGFWIEFANESAQPGSMSIALWGALGTQPATLVKWTDAGWIALGTQTANTNVGFSITGSGAFAVVVGDIGTFAPPPPVVGQPAGRCRYRFSALAEFAGDWDGDSFHIPSQSGA